MTKKGKNSFAVLAKIILYVAIFFKKKFAENRDIKDDLGENRKRIDLFFPAFYHRWKFRILNFNAP